MCGVALKSRHTTRVLTFKRSLPGKALQLLHFGFRLLLKFFGTESRLLDVN